MLHQTGPLAQALERDADGQTWVSSETLPDTDSVSALGLGAGQWKGLVLIALELGELSRAKGSGRRFQSSWSSTGLLQRQARLLHHCCREDRAATPEKHPHLCVEQRVNRVRRGVFAVTEFRGRDPESLGTVLWEPMGSSRAFSISDQIKL